MHMPAYLKFDKLGMEELNLLFMILMDGKALLPFLLILAEALCAIPRELLEAFLRRW